MTLLHQRRRFSYCKRPTVCESENVNFVELNLLTEVKCPFYIGNIIKRPDLKAESPSAKSFYTWAEMAIWVCFVRKKTVR